MISRYIGTDEMCQLLGKSKSTLWRMWKKNGDLPAPKRTPGGSFLGWPEHVYNDWVKKSGAH